MVRRRAEVAAAAYGVAFYRSECGERSPDRGASLEALVVDEVGFVSSVYPGFLGDVVYCCMWGGGEPRQAPGLLFRATCL